jgi:hypothetical protein
MRKIITLLWILFLLASCSSSKDLEKIKALENTVYKLNEENDSLHQFKNNHEATIKIEAEFINEILQWTWINSLNDSKLILRKDNKYELQKDENESINGKFTLYSGSLYLVAWEKHSLHLAIYWWDIYWEEYSLKNENWEHFKKVVNS